MATPTPKSYEQILGEMLATYMSKIGVNDLNTGSAVTSFFEAVAQAVYRASSDTFTILRDFSVDRATGETLKRLAAEENVRILPAQVATGKVTITDTSFTKISTKIYAGTNPPNIGSLVINVSDASQFPASGAIYIGRGTPNVEGPINYVSVVNTGTYWQINLATPTTKYHNINESVILSQGGVRTIPAGTVMLTDASGAQEGVQFVTTNQAIILDGETEVTDVPVAATKPGSDGNIPAGAIKRFLTDPFVGAAVTNPDPFTNGRNEMTDDEIRDAIKRARFSRGLGTAFAIKNASFGARASDENATVVSNDIVFDGSQTTLFVDNGSGYEPKVAGVGFEPLVDSALGGEQFFQLSMGGEQSAVVKAFLESTNSAPFTLSGGEKLSVLVGGNLSEHTFQSSDFKTVGFATAYEVVSSINKNANLLFSARTSSNGTKVVIFAKSETNEDIQITTPSDGSTDAGLILGFPLPKVKTLRLYKNNKPLDRNGQKAFIESEDQIDWSNLMTSGETLIIKVDNTSFVTYTFTDADFAAEGTHTTLSANNTLQSWVNVFNNKITGVTASINGTKIVLESNLGADSRAALEIDPSSTLVTKNMFSASKSLKATGKPADYTLSRNTGQFKLTTPLSAGDSLTAGSDFTQAFIESDPIVGGQVTFSASLPKPALWFLIDDQNASLVTHGVGSNVAITVIKNPGNIIRFRANVANAFSNVQVGDYFILWHEDFSAGNRLEGRVFATGSDILANDYFEVRVTPNEYASAVSETVSYTEGLVFVRTDKTPQKIEFNTGSFDINTIASSITSQLKGGYAVVENEEIIKVISNNKSTEVGSVFLVTRNQSAKNLNFTAGDKSNSEFSHYAFVQSDGSSQFPAFIHSYFTSDKEADPPNTFLTTVDTAIDLSTLIDPNLLIFFKDAYLYGTNFVKDFQAPDQFVQISSIAGTAVSVDKSYFARRVRVNDRFYVLNPLDFDYNDTIVLVLDNDAVNKTFPINVYRNGITNTTAPVSATAFRAYDLDGGTNIEFSQFFGSAYSFDNYKVLMQARNVIDPSGSVNEDAILYRSAEWGLAGERFNVGYSYPTSANQPISHTISIEDKLKIRIYLKSGAPVPNNIDGTTEWNVTVIANNPVAGVDTVTYTWNGNGTNPNMTTLAPGDYVTINKSGEFDPNNTGTFRIVNATATSFTVYRPNGVAVAENNKATLTSSTISLYEDNPTTAQEIVDYVNNNLSAWLSASLVDDNGTTGAGIIDKSTYEDTNFTKEGVDLLDGINWILTTDLSAVAPNPQFTFKKPLALPSFNTNTPNAYTFNNGEQFKLIPTTIEQLNKFLNVLAVTGITTVSDLSIVERDGKIQITSDTLGSAGSIKVTGGSANKAEAKVLNNASLVFGFDNLVQVAVNKAASRGINAGSYVKVEARNKQKKFSDFTNITRVTITPNSPGPTDTTIELSNRNIQDRFFGLPRNHFRDRDRVFHVEKHGSLVCISWNGAGSDPQFTKNVELNDTSPTSDLQVTNNNDGTATYQVTAGNLNFMELQIDDKITFAGFSNTANNGTFKVIGISDDSKQVVVDNANAVNEGPTSIASGNITATTEITEGDIVIIGAPFAIQNQGQFNVVRRYANSIYIENDNAVEEVVTVSYNPIALGFDNTTQWDVIVSSGVMQLKWNGNGTAPDFSNVKLGDVVTVGTAFNANNRGDFMVVEVGSDYMNLLNAKAVAEANITVSGVGGDVLEVHRPAMIFELYENTVVNDRFVINTDILGGDNNIGSYTVKEKLSKYKIVLNAVLASASNVTLGDDFIQVYVEEYKPFVNYKKVYAKFTNPANTEESILIFDTPNVYRKITQLGDVLLTAQSKLDITENLISGVDAYKYYTGLIREVSKIVYGDPRDTITYPGVAAAGAEIFIEPPLIRRISVAINVRVNTGIPFPRVADQVRSNVAAFINSQPIGKSIAISDIIASVNAIPGVRAVSISSPTYDVSNDMIVINPGEKALIIDLINDIIVSKVE